MAYCTIDDLVTRFGEQEIIKLSDRGLQKTNAINVPLVQAKIDDACAEMNVILSECYDVCKLMEMLAGGYSFPALKHWNADIARKHLYDTIRLSSNAGLQGHKADSEYADYEIEIKKLCKGGQLMAVLGAECSIVGTDPKNIGFAIAGDQSSCIPKLCCPDEDCCC